MTTAHTHDHEIKIGSTGTHTRRLDLVRDDSGRKMYQIIEDIPEYRDPLEFSQDNWIGGHGQYTARIADKYFEGQAIDTTQDGRVILGPLITEVKESDDTALDTAIGYFVWFPATSEWLCATAGKIYRFDVSGNAKWTAATTTVAGVTHLCVFKTICYAAVGATTLYYYSADGITWTQTDLSDGKANRFLVAPNAAGTQDVLWKFKTPNEVSNTTDGRTAAAGGVAWSTANYAGDTANNITNLFLVNDNLMIGRVDGQYNLDADGGMHPMRPDLRINRSTDNFKYVTDWQSGVYFSEINGMGEITARNAYEPMGPLTKIDDIGKRGDIVGLAADKDWIYVAIDEGTNSHIYKGREVRTPEGLRWEWCPFVFLGTNACAAIAVCQHSSTVKRLWFGYGTTSGYVYLSDNPTADSAYRFDTTDANWVRMSYTYGTNPYWDKMWQSVVTETKGCATGITVTPKYRKDTDTSATGLTAAITGNGVVKTNLSTALTCNRICFEAHLTTNDNTKTPELLAFQARGVEKPETVRVHECTYSIGDEPNRRAKTIKEFLEGGRTNTSLIKFADLRFGQKTTGSASGDYVWVVMMPGYPKVIEVEHSKERQPEEAIQCRFKEVSFTIS